MRLILGGVNGHYLRYITDNFAEDTEEVWAAVAYATRSDLLFDWCSEHQIPLRFYGRLDDTVAVSWPILKSFLDRASPEFVCYLVQHHHAKVIWWRGVGVYIGSANLTNSAWYKNIEAGCFMCEDEISSETEAHLHELFSTLHKHATPLNDEVLQTMERREAELAAMSVDQPDFWANPCLTGWSGLVQTTEKSAGDRRRESFLKEWHETLQYLRDIGKRVAKDENRPVWIEKHAPVGAQADQFLHAHYYQRTFEGQRPTFRALYEKNRHRREAALAEAIQWWRDLEEAPADEDRMLNESAPFLRDALAEDRLDSMTPELFREVCIRVHAIRDYARRVENKSVGLPSADTGYTIDQKVDALSRRVWSDRSARGYTVKDLFRHVLYGGAEEMLPERLWQAIYDSAWKIDRLGVSAWGELVGWALPDRFPPRNGRTSKALQSLGYDVIDHV
ncbi:MAG: phospholipase [Gammaproteobacteria bacterium]|nr:phospholipase [Gammaproteobacteria bacterium]